MASRLNRHGATRQILDRNLQHRSTRQDHRALNQVLSSRMFLAMGTGSEHSTFQKESCRHSIHAQGEMSHECRTSRGMSSERSRRQECELEIRLIDRKDRNGIFALAPSGQIAVRWRR